MSAALALPRSRAPHVCSARSTTAKSPTANKSGDAEGYRQSHVGEEENREGKKEEESDSEDETRVGRSEAHLQAWRGRRRRRQDGLESSYRL